MRNILLLVVDTLRPDRLGCYGGPRPVSPNLDRLARNGTVLESLWSASNFTAPAFTSLFTASYPHQHGVFDFTAQAASSPIYQVLQQNSVQTGGVVTFRFFKNLLEKIWGPIEAVTDTLSFDYAKDLPAAVTAASLKWLQSNGQDGPFCLFVHYDGPHMPYRLPEKYADTFDTTAPELVDPEFMRLMFPQDREHLGDDCDDGADATTSMFQLLEKINWGKRKVPAETLQWMKDKYDASVFYNDAAIGKLLAGLDDLGLAEDTLVVVLSDHGEEFLEHGGIAHGGIHMYEEIVRTVGIVHDPRLTNPPPQIDQPLSQVDLLPAVLALAGAESIPEAWRTGPAAGLFDQLRGVAAAPEAPAPVFCHGKFKIALRSGRHKLIRPLPSSVLGRMARLRLWAKMLLQRKLGTEIFDLSVDPGEKRNLVGDRALRRRLTQLVDAHLLDRSPAVAVNQDLDEEQRKRIEQELKDLGYM